MSVVSSGELLALVQRNSWGDRRKEYALEFLERGVVTIEISRAVIDAYVQVDDQAMTAFDGVLTR